ncbi:NucA/NucB deoxyribonuclease domain-containing protein [Frondihabitans cladoniiphilus]|uniref:Deoxyribonuclease NucA/NucB domain-containing protein n=1 Tax=Frondihabitans cladoniiphilus TaxID=715785 RepID=A0ABP8WFK0_9MICO
MHGASGSYTSLSLPNYYGGVNSISGSFTSPSFNMNDLASININFIGDHGAPLATPDIPLSEDVAFGHDLDAAARLATANLANSADPCVEAFPVGTHQQGSSLNDQQIECEEARQQGTSLQTFFETFLKTASAAQIAALLANTGTTASSYSAANGGTSSSDPVPSGCSAVLGGTLCPSVTGSQTFVPYTDAPPAQDPLWNYNQQEPQPQPSSPAGDGDDSPSEPYPTPAPITVAPTAPQSPLELIKRQCVADAVQASIDPSKCETESIFATGQYRGAPSEATQHDADAIAANPNFFELTYETSAEKDTETDRTWIDPFKAQNCQGGTGTQCDEFPYYSSEQGAQVFTAPDGSPATDVSLRSISASHNASQGGYYTAFGRQCSLPAQPKGDPKRNFLVVPMNMLPTTWICSDGENQ